MKKVTLKGFSIGFSIKPVELQSDVACWIGAGVITVLLVISFWIRRK